MNDELSTGQLAALIIPLVLIELGLMAFALNDLLRRQRVRGGNKWWWGILIVFFGMIGPIAYLFLGREED
jgi:hypothetical protein